MLITGYHGTTRYCADKILQEKHFQPSVGKDEWLGTGIYFYREYRDALGWQLKNSTMQAEAVLHAVVYVPDDAYLDLDTEEGHYVVRETLRYLQKNKYISDTNAQINQCAVMNLIWDTSPELQLLLASFASERTQIRMLTDARERRREFCVRSNESILSIQEIERVNLYV